MLFIVSVIVIDFEPTFLTLPYDDVDDSLVINQVYFIDLCLIVITGNRFSAIDICEGYFQFPPLVLFHEIVEHALTDIELRTRLKEEGELKNCDNE